MLRFFEWARKLSYPQDDVLEKPGEAFDTDEHGRPVAITRVQDEAQSYNALHGLPRIDHSAYVPVDQARAGRIADAYDALPTDDSKNPAVIAAYTALSNEVVQQYKHAVNHGMTFEPDTKDTYTLGKPYDINEVFRMVADVRDHRHMFFFTGGEPNVFMARIDQDTGWPINDLFRAIHDYFAHCAGGEDFGPVGEDNAWRIHSQMFTMTARRALTVETRGQNSWVNFGRHNYDKGGNYKNIKPEKRPFATQKCAIFDGKNDWINQL